MHLLTQNPIDKITVIAICEIADINRGTFYRYYSDIYAVLEEIESSLLAEMQNFIEPLIYTETPNLHVLNLILELVRRNSAVFKAIYNHTDYSHFNESLSIIMREPILFVFKEKIKPEYSSLQPYLYNYCIAGSIGIISTWIKNDLKESSLEVSMIIQNLLKDGIRAYS